MPDIIASPILFDPPARNSRPLIIPSIPLETVKVRSDETDSGFMIINAADFDGSIHEKFVDKNVEKPSKKGA